MPFLKWFAFIIPDLIIKLVAWFFGWAIAAVSMFHGDWLPYYLWWFQTPDNSLEGDNGWKTEHAQWRFKLPSLLAKYIGRVGWLMRNPAYGLEWDGPLKAVIDPHAKVSYLGNCKVQNSPAGVEGFCFTLVENPDGSWYWHYYYVKKINEKWCWNINLGWKLKIYAEDPTNTLTDPHAAYCFGPRPAKWRVE